MRAIKAIIESATAVKPHSSGLRFLTTKSPNRSMGRRRPLARGLTRNGSIDTSAGMTVIEKTQAATTPMAAMLPISWNGGASEKLRLKKPIVVVRLVRNTGSVLTRRLSTRASCLERSARIS